MPEVLYTDTVWTAGDVITEAKLDNMTANDRAVDAMYQGIQMTERAAPSAPPSNTLHLYAKDNTGVSCLYFIDDAGTEHQLRAKTPIFTFPITGTLVVGSSLTNALIATEVGEITKAYAYVKTAPVGAHLILDINKNGASLWASTPANKLRINAGSQSGTQTNFDVITLADGSILTLDVDQVGSTTAGADLTVQLKTK
jgi:hypothetical protein